mmetsp:Transcript_12472/g.32048  ORF Transcript_12472/g.32048 Transcript_12472/m.32048 type:complete len:264 (-) Transcript_12472:488-1279(-)
MRREHPLLVRCRRLAELVDIEGAHHVPLEPLLRVLHLDAVRRAVVPALGNGPRLPAPFRRRQHLGPDLEAQLGVDLALEEAVDEALLVQVLADEDEPALALLAAPQAHKVAVEDHADALEDVLGVGALHVEDALVTVEVGAVLIHHQADPLLHEAQVQRRVELRAAACHRWIVLVLAVRVQELRVHLQHAGEAKGLDADQAFRVHSALLRPGNLHGRVDLLQAILYRRQLRFLHQVRLVQQDAVGERHLLHRLVLDALRLLVV